LWIERQDRLQALQPVKDHEAGKGECQHRDGIGDPMLFRGFIDAGQAVQDFFQRS
jgi:hypothetical protein